MFFFVLVYFPHVSHQKSEERRIPHSLVPSRSFYEIQAQMALVRAFMYCYEMSQSCFLCLILLLLLIE